MRIAILAIGTLAVSLCPAVRAATLEKLELDDMIRKASEIVRGQVTAKNVTRQGAIIYTEATVTVTERLKGETKKTVKVSTPGGSIDGVTQTFPGSPNLHTGAEYVFFLWTGKSGVTQIVGLSQGLLDLTEAVTASGAKLSRAAIADGVVDPDTGKRVADAPVSLTLGTLRSRVRSVLGAAKE
ncbi:MAG: hypothetical protein R2762_05130 [Bryobacteraceae bacterium]